MLTTEWTAAPCPLVPRNKRAIPYTSSTLFPSYVDGLHLLPADHRLQNRADEVVRVLRTRAGPDRVGDENPCSRSDRSQPGALKQAVGFAVLGPASCAEPFGFGKHRGERQNRQLQTWLETPQSRGWIPAVLSRRAFA